MDIITIFSIITAISTSTFALLAVYKYWTRPRLKITGYGKTESTGVISFYAEVTRKGRRIAKRCLTQIQVSNYRYNGMWENGYTKQDIYTSEKLLLFNIDKAQKTIIFLGDIKPEFITRPISDYRDKNLEIVVTSENTESVSDKKTISQIFDKTGFKMP